MGAVAGALAIAAVGVAIPLLAGGSTAPVQQRIGPVLPSGLPLLGATPTTIAEASAILGFEIPRPDDVLARDDSIVGVWVSPDNGAAAIDYSSGIRLIVLSQEDQSSDVKGHFGSIAASIPGASVQTVQGEPALVLPENNPGNGCPELNAVCIPKQENRGSVTFWLGKLEIKVLGHLSSDDLLRVAGSIK